MATNIEAIVPYDTVAHFDRIAARIEQTIDPLINQLIERKITLLQEVEKLRDDFHNKETARLTAIQELDKAELHLRQGSRCNVNLQYHEQAGLVYQHARQQRSVPTPLPNLRVSCPSLTLLQTQIQQFVELVQQETPHYSQIEQFGELVQTAPHMTQKREPILTAGKKGNGENELSACGLALDEINKKVYIADFDNSRVQVLSFEGDFLTQFGKNVLFNPWGLSLNEDHVFVTDTEHHTLFQFCKNCHQLLNRAGREENNEVHLSSPRGLSVDSNGDVFVADCLNNRVTVFNKLLDHKQRIGHESLFRPKDVKLTTDKVVVLDGGINCVHVFSRDGDIITSCVSHGEGQECLVYEPNLFCLDFDENIIISDYTRHDIKIVSNCFTPLEGKGARKANLFDH